MAYSYDIRIDQGSSLNLNVVARDANGTPLNLSGYVARGKVKYQYGDVDGLLNLTATIDPSYISGLINISMTSYQTRFLPITKAVYDVEVLSDSYTFRVLNGYAEVHPSVLAGNYTGVSPAFYIGQTYCGKGAPTFVPNEPFAAAIYYDTDTYQTYFWNIINQSW